MSYGISVSSDSGYTLIDGNFKNYKIVQSGTVVSANTTVWLPAYTTFPLIFVRPSSYGNSTTFDTAGASGDTSNISYIRLQPCKYVILAPAEDIPTSSESHGIRIWDASGKLVFDSSFTVATIDTVAYMDRSLDFNFLHLYGQTIGASQPPLGERYLLLNTLGRLGAEYSYSDDGCGGCGGNYVDYYQVYDLMGKLNSETSISYWASEAFIGFADYWNFRYQYPILLIS